jgi:DNA-directed RNA polymerase specialized sigma24 family protein
MVELFYFKRMKSDEVGRAMNTTETAVRKRLERVRKALMECVQKNLASGEPHAATN